MDIQDIAWSLSRIPRFNGHTVSKIPYSVAQHCIFVSEILEKQNHSNLIQLYGLLHDATECYMTDIISPVKQISDIRSIIKKIEKQIEECIFDALNIKHMSDQDHITIKNADLISQRIEGHAYMPSRGKYWVLPEVSIIDLQNFSDPLPATEAYSLFMERYEKLMLRHIRLKSEQSTDYPI